jgi:hypothetical protein
MSECFAKDPKSRPKIDQVIARLKDMCEEQKLNIIPPLKLHMERDRERDMECRESMFESVRRDESLLMSALLCKFFVASISWVSMTTGN